MGSKLSDGFQKQSDGFQKLSEGEGTQKNVLVHSLAQATHKLSLAEPGGEAFRYT